MGIPNLNRFLLSNCSAQSIGKKHISILSDKTIVIDTSIYLYKFSGNDALIENMYLLVTIFKYYRVQPIFIFDGKPPSEKKDVIEQRYIDKQTAEKKYKELQLLLETTNDNKDELLVELNKLKKQFIRIKKDDILLVKSLLESCGVTYYDAPGEADQLCAKMVINKEAWACLSDDMDMFAYGCTRVLRHISLLNHTVVFYNTVGILRELDIPMYNFREILILSGTDYNHSEPVKINEIVKQYRTFASDTVENISFYEWLCTKSINRIDTDVFKNIYRMFHITDMVNYTQPVKSKCNLPNMKQILHAYGFVFV